MKRPVLLAVSIGLALAASTIDPAHAAPTRFSWSGAVDPEAGLTVRVHEGDVTVRQGTGDQASVTARLRGPRREVELVELEAVESKGGVEIAAEYPRRRSREEPVTRVRIDIEVVVPAGVKVVARTEKGRIEAVGIDGPVDAATAIGDVVIATRSWARGRSVNGDVRAEIGSTDWSGEIAFKTVNGDIEVSVPAAVDSKLRVRTRNGRFRTDLFPVDRGPGAPGANISGQLGEGGERRLVLETVNGDIRLGAS